MKEYEVMKLNKLRIILPWNSDAYEYLLLFDLFSKKILSCYKNEGRKWYCCSVFPCSSFQVFQEIMLEY